jgi:hypothetical protein
MSVMLKVRRRLRNVREYQLPNAIDLHSGMAPAGEWADRGLVSKD